MSRIAVCVIAVLVLVFCMGSALHADTPVMELAVKKTPDLVIQRMIFENLEPKLGYQVAHLRVRVKNIGEGAASSFKVSVCFFPFVAGDTAPTPIVETVEVTEALAAGDAEPVYVDLNFMRRRIALTGLLLAVVDPPTQEHHGGEVGEHGPFVMLNVARADTNNVFGVILNNGVPADDTRWDNDGPE